MVEAVVLAVVVVVVAFRTGGTKAVAIFREVVETNTTRIDIGIRFILLWVCEKQNQKWPATINGKVNE
jgi:hypothetical protein